RPQQGHRGDPRAERQAPGRSAGRHRHAADRRRAHARARALGSVPTLDTEARVPRHFSIRRAALVALALPAALAVPALLRGSLAQRRLWIACWALVREAERGRVADIGGGGNRIRPPLVWGGVFTAYAPHDPAMVDRFIGRGVRISGVAEPARGDGMTASVT